MTKLPDPERGQIVWHSSDEDGGPDVGAAIGTGNGEIWVGELSRRRWEMGGAEAMGLGRDDGSWIVFYPHGGGEAVLLGRCPADVLHSEIADLFANMLRPEHAIHDHA